MLEGSKRESLVKIASLLFVLLYFTTEFFEVRHARVVAGVQSALFFGMAAALHRFARGEPGIRWLLGAGLLLGVAGGTGALGMTHGTLRGVLVAAAALLFAIGIGVQWRHARGRERRRGGSSADAPE